MSGQDANWHNRLNQSLQNEESRLNALLEIKDHFQNVPQDHRIQDAAQLQLPLLFDCLNNANSEQVDLACEVLTICISNLSVGESTGRYSDSLVRSLHHPNNGVKIMALKEIERCTLNEHLIKQVCDQSSLVTALFECISEEDLKVANFASNILVTIGKNEIGLTKLLQRNYIELINNSLQGSEIVRFRIYSIIIEIACNNGPSFQAMVNLGWIGLLIEEISNTDVLVQLNALELLSNLAATSYGRLHIESQNILHNISIHLNKEEMHNLNSSLLLPGLLKFFGNIAYWDPESIFASYPSFSSALFCVDNFSDPTLFGITIDTIGHIGSTCRGKIVLNQLDTKLQNILKFLGNFVIDVPSEKQVRILSCFENLFRVPTIESNFEQAIDIVQKWFGYIAPNTIDLLLKYIRIPFPELRLAGLNCLHALAEQNWGQDVILQTAGLPEYLLDRTEENMKDIKDIKYEIIKCLVTSNSPRLRQFKTLFDQFIKDGPYYSSLQTFVAVEGD